MDAIRNLDRNIWMIAWPAILSNISIPILGLVDAAMLGHLQDTRYLAAVALGGAILSFLYWGFGFLRMGTTGHVARARGAGDDSLAFLVLARSAALGLAIALVVMLLGPAWIRLGLAVMQPAESLSGHASAYMGIRLLSAPAVLITYAIVGWFIGCQNTRWPMVILLLTNTVNILLDSLFIIGMGLNSDGAAMATVCAEYCGLLLGLFAVYRAAPQFPGIRELRAGMTDRRAYGTLWRSNRNLLVRTLSLLACFAFFTAMGEKLGQDVVAANALMLQFLLFAAFALDGVAYAAEGMAGSRLGARDLAGFYRVVSRCALWSAAGAGIISLVVAMAQPVLLPLLSDIDGVRQILADVHVWLILLPLLAAPSYLLDGVFIGAAETRPLMTTMLFSALMVYLPVWYFTREFGNHGLWLAFALFNAARGVSLAWVFRRFSRRGRWLAGTDAARSVTPLTG
ncbi:MATE family efflux transporter [Chromatocurvus halotolerans]|uniref:MATE family multidrug resistance protein n=1 Tax=Chromatocurvus halotolerans TaxID=1132028 RepID=A0A4R2KQG8_9GAMM|nr:MATE family efflux transporter [Chromatocurvus halotolerans]TCO73176.1 MATE family multidrug resistance protein [Chromatocurvus halotolerans]